MRQESAPFVGKSSQSTDIQEQRPAARLVGLHSVKRTGKKEPVYNMLVEDNHDFCDGNGIVLHNCDALRYFCYTIIRKPEGGISIFK